MTREVCEHCGGEIAIRMPNAVSGCDHLYYPENCPTCKTMIPKLRGRDEEIKKLKQDLEIKDYVPASTHELVIDQIVELKKQIESRNALIGKLVDESQKVINWFEALGNKQKDLLVKHQSLETASKNWEEAAGLDNLNSLDFQPMMDLIAEARKFQEGK